MGYVFYVGRVCVVEFFNYTQKLHLKKKKNFVLRVFKLKCNNKTFAIRVILISKRCETFAFNVINNLKRSTTFLFNVI